MFFVHSIRFYCSDVINVSGRRLPLKEFQKILGGDNQKESSASSTDYYRRVRDNSSFKFHFTFSY